MLSFEDRQKEIKRLQEEHKSVLCTPLMSEGSISPFQVGQMSNNQRSQWQKNAQKRLEIESQIRELSLTDSEIQDIEKKQNEQKVKNKLCQIESLINSMSNFKGKNGKILPKYQKEITRLELEKKSLLS